MRQGSILMWILILLGLASVVSTMAFRQYRSYADYHQQHSIRLQAREWALGARALPVGEHATIDGWLLRHGPNHTRATHPDHPGWWIAWEDARVSAEGPEAVAP